MYIPKQRARARLRVDRPTGRLRARDCHRCRRASVTVSAVRPRAACTRTQDTIGARGAVHIHFEHARKRGKTAVTTVDRGKECPGVHNVEGALANK